MGKSRVACSLKIESAGDESICDDRSRDELQNLLV
jgi:hypothetical protein